MNHPHRIPAYLNFLHKYMPARLDSSKLFSFSSPCTRLGLEQGGLLQRDNLIAEQGSLLKIERRGGVMHLFFQGSNTFF